MIEFNIPPEQHIKVEENANQLLLISVAAIGNISATILSNEIGYKHALLEHKSELEFASRYFDAFFNSAMEPNYNYYYVSAK